jgi:hypothetical protein
MSKYIDYAKGRTEVGWRPSTRPGPTAPHPRAAHRLPAAPTV